MQGFARIILHRGTPCLKRTKCTDSFEGFWEIHAKLCTDKRRISQSGHYARRSTDSLGHSYLSTDFYGLRASPCILSFWTVCTNFSEYFERILFIMLFSITKHLSTDILGYDFLITDFYGLKNYVLVRAFCHFGYYPRIRRIFLVMASSTRISVV